MFVVLVPLISEIAEYSPKASFFCVIKIILRNPKRIDHFFYVSNFFHVFFFSFYLEKDVFCWVSRCYCCTYCNTFIFFSICKWSLWCKTIHHKCLLLFVDALLCVYYQKNENREVLTYSFFINGLTWKLDWKFHRILRELKKNHWTSLVWREE